MKAALLLTLVLASAPAAADTYRVAYPDGKPRFELELAHGLPNGQGRGWNPNGTLAFEGSYANGARNGRFKLYDGDGALVAQAMFFDNVEVWRSTDPAAEPPREWLDGLANRPQAEHDDDTVGARWVSRQAPRLYFSLMDRTVRSGAGAQLGIGDADGADFGSVIRFDVFGHYRFGAFGAFAQVSETRLTAGGLTLIGRSTALIGGSYHRELAFATLSASGGVLFPVANADAEGFVAGSAGAVQRPTDEAMSVPAPFGVRSAASLSRVSGRLVAQLDGGIDWMLGGEGRAFDPIARANAGVGYGRREVMLTLELDNTVRLADTGTHHHAVALGASFGLPAVWFSLGLARSVGGTTTLLGTVGREL